MARRLKATPQIKTEESITSDKVTNRYTLKVLNTYLHIEDTTITQYNGLDIWTCVKPPQIKTNYL